MPNCSGFRKRNNQIAAAMIFARADVVNGWHGVKLLIGVLRDSFLPFDEIVMKIVWKQNAQALCDRIES
jgi:hypothetical protein